jgi:hypothetical protein
VEGSSFKDVKESIGLCGPESDSLSESVHSVVGGDSSTGILYDLACAIPPLYACVWNHKISPNDLLSTVLSACGYTGVIVCGGNNRSGLAR